MVTVTGIKKAFGGRICRYCINSRCGIRLKRKDCRYEKYSDICPACGERKHIVKRLTPVGYLKGIGKKIPAADQTGTVQRQEPGEAPDGDA